MKKIIVVLRIIYTAYAAIVFTLLLIVTTPFFFIFLWILKDKALHIILTLCRFIAYSFGFLCFIFYRIKRNNNVDENKPYVIIANHRSNIDGPVAAVATKGRVRFLAKKELIKVPILGPLIKISTVIVDRSSKESRFESMQVLMACLKNGDDIFIFPEGTRNKTKDKQLIDYKDGAFNIAIQTKTPILPLIFLNSDTVMPNHPMLLRPGVIDIIQLDPVDVSNYKEPDVQKLKMHVKQIMWDALEKYK